MSRTEAKLVSCFASGLSRCRLHPGDHPSIVSSVAEALDALRALKVEQSLAIEVCEGGGMLINGVRVSTDTPAAKNFFLRLRRKKVGRLMISKGLQADELEKFFTDLASSYAFLPPYNAIAVTSSRNAGEMPTLAQRPRDDLHQVTRLYRDLSVHGNINMAATDSFTGNCIAQIRKGERLPDMLVHSKTAGYDLCIHSANVAMLSIFQAEHLGLGNALLHDIGLAALLHDVGKTTLSKDILDRQDSLNEPEWAVIKKHPVTGAMLLSSLSKVPEIAMVVAYEHHMKYDGSGYPETRRRAKKQHIISQIVAIADFYSALKSDVSHRNSLDDSSIMGLLTETAGREFNPQLVDSFVQALKGQSAASP